MAIDTRLHTSTPVEVAATDAPTPLFVVEPAHRWVGFGLRELWEYRELLYFLAWRDVKVRYKQTGLGVAWAVLQPLAIMLVFSVFFGYLGKMPSDGIPYPLFVFAGLVPWQLFAYSLSSSGNSLVMNRHLLTKVYFPRLLVPLGAVCVGIVDFGASFIILLGMMTYYREAPGMGIWTLPIFVILAVITALAVGLWLATLSVQYRDTQIMIPFITQLWLFVTPVAYSATLVPEKWRMLYALNPMVGVVEGFRWALLGQSQPDIGMIALSAGMSFLLLLGGVLYFRRVEDSFADVI